MDITNREQRSSIPMADFYTPRATHYLDSTDPMIARRTCYSPQKIDIETTPPTHHPWTFAGYYGKVRQRGDLAYSSVLSQVWMGSGFVRPQIVVRRIRNSMPCRHFRNSQIPPGPCCYR